MLFLSFPGLDYRQPAGAQQEGQQAQGNYPDAHQPFVQIRHVFGSQALVKEGILQPFQLVDGHVRDQIVQAHREKSDHDQKAGPGHHLGIVRVHDEEIQGNDAADHQMDNPKGPPVGAEGDEVQAGHNTRDLGLVAHEELQGLQKDKTE